MNKPHRFLVTCSVLAVHFAFVGCLGSALQVDGYKCPDLVRTGIYYGDSVERRLREIRTYPLEKQYAVFICGVQHVRPPQWDAAQPFAENGANAADFLVRKLPHIHNDATIRNIVTLAGDMDARGLYPVEPDTELWRALELAVSRMKNPIQKQESEIRLRKLGQ